MNQKTTLIALLCTTFLLCTADSCDVGSKKDTQSVKQVEAQKSIEAAAALNFTDNAERENIVKRLKLTSQPGLLGFIVLLNSAGQPIMYTAVQGKVTSSTKRLTPNQQVNRYGIGGTSGGEGRVIINAPSDEGTFGSSDEYVFFWTPGGQYIQWKGEYLYSDKPIRLSIQPLVVMAADGGPVTSPR